MPQPLRDYFLDFVSSMQQSKKEESLDHWDGTSDMNSMIQTWTHQYRCLGISWLMLKKSHGTQ